MGQHKNETFIMFIDTQLKLKGKQKWEKHLSMPYFIHTHIHENTNILTEKQVKKYVNGFMIPFMFLYNYLY